MIRFFLCLNIFAFTLVSAFAQTPQSVCYQGVAASPTGSELINQALGVRFSILQGSAAGSPVYVETHNTTTDAFGLFNVNVGLGLPALGTFSAINWGSGTYFLKVELDPTGGSVYQLLGTSQMLSVPYALYANKAAKADTSKFALEAEHAINADSSSFATTSLTALNAVNSDTATFSTVALSALQSDTALYCLNEIGDNDKDSTNEIQDLSFNAITGELSLSGSASAPVNIFSGSFTAPGASFDYPQGLIGYGTTLYGEGDNTVPAGFTLYLTGGLEQFQIKQGTSYFNHLRFPSFPVFPSLTVVKDCYCSGILLPNSNDVQAVIINFNNYPLGYTVPVGKKFILKSGTKTLFVTNAALGLSNAIFQPYENSAYSGSMIFPSNTVLNPFGISTTILTGYLIDEN